MTTNTLDALHNSIVSALRDYVADPDAAAAHGKRAADLIVTARALFTDRRGRSDIAGRSKAWRDWAAEVYRDADIDPQSATAGAVRYHIGNALRDRYDAETLEDYGLRAASPRDRGVERHERDRAVMNAAVGGDPLDTLAEVAAAAASMRRNLARIALVDLPEEDQAKARAMLSEVAAIAAAVAA